MITSSPVPGPAATVAALVRGPRFPEQEFLHSGATFGEVYAMAARLRAAFAGREGDLVCLAAEDRAIIAAALLAALAGGPVLLLPYAFSAQALAGMQAATGFTVAITDVARDFPAGTEIFRPEQGEDEVDFGFAPRVPRGEVLRLFTGGSTGAPRLWPKTGGNIFAEALFLVDHFGISHQDRIVATVSPYHIYGLLYSVVLPLVSGATIVAATPAFPEEIIGVVTETEASILVSVPAHYRALRDKPSLGPSLRLALSSAGMLDIDDNKAFCQRNPAGIVEVYGSTETGGVGLRHRARGEEAFTPYSTVTWSIAGERLRIRSPYLSPNLPVDEEGWYVTGDRVEPHGQKSFVLRGRADSITKVGGKRVDLEEIGSLIKEQAGVADCAVLAVAEQGGRGHRIAALVAGQGVDAARLRAALAVRLEPYALPRVIRVVDRLPMTASGKYDRSAMLRLVR